MSAAALGVGLVATAAVVGSFFFDYSALPWLIIAIVVAVARFLLIRSTARLEAQADPDD